MSTNKTTNYNLHAWEPTDDFLRAEINENFAAIDSMLNEKKTVVIGQYAGSGSASRTIDVGRPILALLIENDLGSRFDSPYKHGGLIIAGEPTRIPCSINGNAFQVQETDGQGGLNAKSSTYTYIAWVE